MRALIEPKRSPKPAVRKVLKKFCYCLKQYDDPKTDIAYRYGERALTGLLASASWMVRDGWSLEEFTGQRKKGRRKNCSGKGDLWLGVGRKSYTIEAKVTWPTQLKDVNKWKTTVAEKLSKAGSQLNALDKSYRAGKPIAICYVVPAIPTSTNDITNKTLSLAMRTFAKVVTESNRHTEVMAYWITNFKNAPKDSNPKNGHLLCLSWSGRCRSIQGSMEIFVKKQKKMHSNLRYFGSVCNAAARLARKPG